MDKEAYKETLEDLRKRYKKTAIDKKEVAKELGVCLSTINNSIRAGRGIPNYRQVGMGTQKKIIVFPLVEVAKFLADTERVY